MSKVVKGWPWASIDTLNSYFKEFNSHICGSGEVKTAMSSQLGSVM